MTTEIQHIQPKLGEGIYLVKDVAKILRLDYQKTYRWINGYWGIQGGLNENVQYTFGEVGNKGINFFSLIEFYTFFKLREKDISSTQIKKFHNALSIRFNTPYPFAIAHDFFIENRKKKKFIYYDYLDSLIKFDKREQFSLKLVERFLEKIEFENNIAIRFFPLSESKNIVVDPKHQFGQPIISGTNIKASTIYGYHLGGDKNEDIARLYKLKIKEVKDAIQFCKAA